MKLCKLIIVLLISISASNLALADLLVSPMRVSFDERDRTKQVTLINSGQQKRTYRLEWQEQKSDEFGSYAEVTDPAFRSASPYLRFSPRQVTLNPGERQVVKLLLRRKGDMLDGEYRSHLKFEILPSQDQLQSNGSGTGVSMKLNLFLSYSIPVIVKKGKAHVNPVIDDLRIGKDEKDRISFEVAMSKSSEYGVTGNVVAYFKDTSNQLTKLALLNSINFFHEQNVRKVKLVTVADLPQQPGSIVVTYTGAQEFAGKILAQREFPI